MTTAVPTYNPEADNCAGGCARNTTLRVAFPWMGGQHFACPGCYESIFGGPPSPRDIIDIAAWPAAFYEAEPCSWHGQPDVRTCPGCARGDGPYARPASDDPSLDCAEHGFTYRIGSVGCPACLQPEPDCAVCGNCHTSDVCGSDGCTCAEAF